MEKNEGLHISQLYSGYEKGIDVIQGVEMSIPEGVIACIIGPNGAGKSTLLKTIFGTVQAREGEICLKGESIADLSHNSRLRKGIGYVAQEHNNFPLMTVDENLDMGGFIVSAPKLKKRKQDIYQKFKMLDKFRSKRATLLSGGQQRILEIAMTLLHEPQLMLLDEPSLGLAPKPMAEVFSIVKRINELGVTVIMVEQNAKKGLEVSDIGFVLEQGRVVLSGDASDICSHPDIKHIYLGGKA